MQSRIDISKLNKAEVLAALYNNSKIQGMGFFGQQALGSRAAKPMTIDEAQVELDRNSRKYFDYLHGKVMKVDLSKDSFDPYLYDRDNGQGAATRVVGALQKGAKDELKKSQNAALKQVERDLKQEPEDVLQKSTITIISLPATPVLLGQKHELSDKEFTRLSIDIYSNKIQSMPKLRSDQRLVCAYNQWGIGDMIKMYECLSVEHMQQLYNSYYQGGAITIDWFAMTDKILENEPEIRSYLAI